MFDIVDKPKAQLMADFNAKILYSSNSYRDIISFIVRKKLKSCSVVQFEMNGVDPVVHAVYSAETFKERFVIRERGFLNAEF